MVSLSFLVINASLASTSTSRGLATSYNNVHCPAWTIYNQDVLIRLVSIEGNATGDAHYEALRRLSTGQTAFRGDNYAIPLLNELEFNGLRFVVFPLLSFGYIPWFYNVDEILDYLAQIFTGIKFCHDNLFAHLDLDSDNIQFNFLELGRNLTGLWNLMSPGHFGHIFPFDIISMTSIWRSASIRTRILEPGKSPAYQTYEWADVWYLGRMLNSDMDTEVRGFIEKQLKATREDASFDDVFGKYFAQDVLETEYMMKVFEDRIWV
ncbi:hypothetical protein EDD85DRAFT_1027886 [Armillaria nabsnona]|nr:hypothetical protein EDD85DRAFT_1027886 [Armillaria nabsnona]